MRLLLNLQPVNHNSTFDIRVVGQPLKNIAVAGFASCSDIDQGNDQDDHHDSQQHRQKTFVARIGGTGGHLIQCVFRIRVLVHFYLLHEMKNLLKQYKHTGCRLPMAFVTEGRV
ncbi:hypothetical protein D3C81_1664640 [compost metagenome]